MKRKWEEGFASNKLVNETHQQCYCCLLDLNYSSKLLSTKIADIPHKLKYETIIAPIFEYCFGTSDQDKVWEYPNDEEITQEEHESNNDKLNHETDYSSSIINLKIDWIRDETFLYSQIFNLIETRLDILARKFGLWNDRKFIIHAIRNFYFSSGVLYYVDSQKLNDDRELVMEAVKEQGGNLQYAPDKFKNDKEIVIQAVKQDGFSLDYASEEMKDDKEIVLIALESTSFAYNSCSERLRNDREVVIKAVSNGLSLSLVSKKFNNDRELLMNNVFETLKFACSELRNDKEIVLNAIKQQHPLSFEYASDELKKDREFVKEIVKKNGECLRYASNELLDDKELVELALKSSISVYYCISDRLRKDTEFISKLIGKRGFPYLPRVFSNDRDIVLESIKLRCNNLKLASTELQNDREFILHVVKNCGMALKCVNEEFKSDREIIMEAITQNGMAIEFVPDQYLDDKEIILKAAETTTTGIPELKTRDRFGNDDREFMKKCGVFINYFPRKYQLDKEIVMEIVKTYADVVSICYPLIARERALAMRIVKRNGLLLRELPFKYRNDRELVSFAIQQNKKAFKFVSDELKNDLQILELLKGDL